VCSKILLTHAISKKNREDIMKINPVTLGTFLLILGLIFCQFGLLLVLHQATFTDFILGIMPFQLVEILGAFLQLLGSALIVFGIVSLVNGITTEVIRDQTYRLSETILRVEERLGELNVQKTQKSICKFCGTPIRDESIFCPVCGKSQK
jgi:membrane-bound ClpP family serine protease